MIAHVGLVLHIQEGSEAGSETWLKDPKSQASAHFLVGKDGRFVQLVDTDDKAWAEAAGNPQWVSVECEGNSGDSLTGPQVENVAHLLAWLHGLYGIPLRSTDTPNGGGLGWHGMGGASWGGHYDCPGDPIKQQRPQIIARATELSGAVMPDINPPLVRQAPTVSVQPAPAGFYELTEDGAIFAWCGAPFEGGANGKPYFAGRKARKLHVPGDDGHAYTIEADTRERYSYPE